MGIVLDVLLLVVGFGMLIKGADVFVEGASGIADRFGIPQIVIGLTIVAFGTSAPEAAVSITAGIKAAHTGVGAGLAIGNVVGSNIMNILLILGITACIIPLKVKKNTIKFEIPFVIIITAMLVLFGGVSGYIGKLAGVIFWIIMIGFMIYLIRMSKNSAPEESIITKKRPVWLLLIMTVVGLIMIVWGSDVTVDHASNIASALGMSDRLIGLTIVAFGTSLPELITSVMAAKKGNADIAIGNIVGSNIFNILFVLGTTALIVNVPYEPKFIVDGIVATVTAAILFLCVVKKKELRRGAGIFMLLCYAGYFTYLLV